MNNTSQTSMKIRSISNIHSVLKEAIRDLNAENGSLMIIDSKTEELSIKVAYSQLPSKELNEDIINKTRIKMGESISGFVAQSQKPLLINNIKDILNIYPNII